MGLIALEPGGAARRVEADAERHRASLADRLPGVLQDLAGEAHPVAQRAAVFVGAGAVVARQEVVEDAETVGRVDGDDVEAGRFRAPRRVAVPAP